MAIITLHPIPWCFITMSYIQVLWVQKATAMWATTICVAPERKKMDMRDITKEELIMKEEPSVLPDFKDRRGLGEI